MAIRVTCSACDTRFKVADEKAGRRVRCPECDDRVLAPDDEVEDDRPIRRKPRAQSGLSIGWIIAGLAGVVVLIVLVVVGVATMVLVNRGVDALGRFGEPLPLDLTKGKTILNQNSMLAVNDPRDPKAANGPMKAFPVQLNAGKNYIIALESRAFDAYLRLENPKGDTVAQDDDSGGGLNARIHYNATAAGQYRVIATTFDEDDFGAFKLIVQELP